MALDMFSSTSEANDQRIAATDQATVQRGKGNVKAEGKAKTASGSKSKFMEKGSVDLSGSKISSTTNSGLKFGNVGAGATITVQDGGEAAALTAEKLGNSFSDAIGKLVEGTSQTAANAVNQAAATTAQAGTAGAELETKDGTSKKKLWLAVGIGGALLLGFFFWRKLRK